MPIKRLDSISAVAAAAVLGLAVLPAGASAQTGVPLERATPVAALGGVAVYSEFAPIRPGSEEGEYFLVARRGELAARLPVAPRPGPFDVDLGADADGEVVAVYSRCRVDPFTTSQPNARADILNPLPVPGRGRGCDIYRYDFDTARETRVAGASTSAASEFLPSLSGDRIAFARVYERRSGRRGDLPYLYTRRLSGGSSQRERGGSRGTRQSGLPGPSSLDLSGSRLAFTWSYENEPVRRGRALVRRYTSEVRLNSVGGRPDSEVVMSESFEGSSGSFRGVSIDSGRVYAGFQRYSGPCDGATDCRSLRSSVYRHRIANGDTDRGNVPAFVAGAAQDGSRTVVSTATGNPTSQAAEARLITLSGLTFR